MLNFQFASSLNTNKSKQVLLSRVRAYGIEYKVGRFYDIGFIQDCTGFYGIGFCVQLLWYWYQACEGFDVRI